MEESTGARICFVGDTARPYLTRASFGLIVSAPALDISVAGVCLIVT